MGKQGKKESGISMNRPLTLKLAAFFMLILALLVGGLAAARQFGLISGVLGRRVSEAISRRIAGSIQPTAQPGDGQETQPPAGNQLPQNGKAATRLRRLLLRQGGQISGMLGNIVNWAGIVLGVLGLLVSYLLWKPARWGIILAVILSVLVLLTSLPNLLTLRQAFTLPVLWLNIVPALLRLLLATLVLVLALLPASRAATARVSDMPKERVVL